MRPLTPLCELALKHMTDKGGRHNLYNGNFTETCHEYTPVYSDLLSDRRLDVEDVLEIGVNGGCSLRMWREYFPRALIVGLDIEQGYLINEERIQCVLADQGSEVSLMTAMCALDFRKFDLIVDDGSHDVDHQICSARTLLPFLKPGGFYVIEDLTCAPDVLIERILGLDHDVLIERVLGLDHDPVRNRFQPEVFRCEPGRGNAANPENLLVFHG